MQGQHSRGHHFQTHAIPWFGAVQGWAQVPPEASINEYDDPAAIMVLTEGGQLMVHDLTTFQPVPVSLPFQELQAVTDSCLCASPALQGLARPHSLTLERLRVRRLSAFLVPCIADDLGSALVLLEASMWKCTLAVPCPCGESFGA